MTTIAISTTHVAADGQRTWGNEIRGLDHKKLRVEGRIIYAYTGLTPLMDVMIRWHKDGAKPENLPPYSNEDGDGWTLIIIDRHGVGKYTASCPYVERLDAPIAFGAGDDLAMGAMLAGASAERAIELVASITNHTGGEIQVINIAEALGLHKEAAE